MKKLKWSILFLQVNTSVKRNMYKTRILHITNIILGSTVI